MTDLEKLKKVFDEIGQEYKIEERKGITKMPEIKYNLTLTITGTEIENETLGYEGMFCDFLFLDGKRVATGCWE